MLNSRTRRRLQDLDMMRRNTGVGRDEVDILRNRKRIVPVFILFPVGNAEINGRRICDNVRSYGELGVGGHEFYCRSCLHRLSRCHEVQ